MTEVFIGHRDYMEFDVMRSQRRALIQEWLLPEPPRDPVVLEGKPGARGLCCLPRSAAGFGAPRPAGEGRGLLSQTEPFPLLSVAVVDACPHWS